MKVPSYNDLELTFIIVKPYVNLKSHKKDSQYGDSATSKNRLLHISFHTTYAFFNNLEFIYTWICNILLLALYPFRKYPNIFPQRVRPVYTGFLNLQANEMLIKCSYGIKKRASTCNSFQYLELEV